ncbi:LysR family transcriptional regulator [Herbiconiux sp. CPCC 203407]|uniref:LysR family transcriptional regulator n=1 Tax=Herbiconiux oxytropis TaxID=2970915 RepID=A0AA41XIP3_9MICO|nr:LysR family transcriptional regulator [Herbiconiux oxytropis]MCS5721673.1 LysR family transcriptional regulator [Herbiconiux oxytropis]MCS5726700.1 LysR family transcriptional regulator [Herbiconiux oxytropis]
MASIVSRLLDGRVRMRHFVLVQAVAEHGTLSGAAAELGVTQPYVTRSLQELEAAIGTVLFDRGPRGVTPTPQGQIFVEYAAAVLNTMRQAGERLDDFALGASTGLVRVGVNLATVHMLLPEAILRFKETASWVTISLVEEYQNALRAMLSRNELDMLVGRIPTERSSENQYLRLYEDPLVLAVRKEHPMLGRDVGVPDLMDLPWIVPGYSSVFRSEIDGLFLVHGLSQPRNLIESSTITATRPILRRIDAVAVLPRSLVLADPALAPLSVTVDTVPREIGITIRGGAVEDPVLTDFIACVVTVARELSEQPQLSSDRNPADAAETSPKQS